ANALKDQGNKAFAAKDYDTAIDLFSKAIALDPKNHVLWSNRSAAKAGKREYEDALADAEEASGCIKVNPSWAKGYARKGAALHGARRYDEAIVAYEDGIKLEDSPALRKGLQEVKDARRLTEDPMGFGKMLSDPNAFAKLTANPRTAKYLADPAFLQMLQQNPRMADSSLQDPRMIDVLGALMGIDIQASTRPEGSDEMPEGIQRQPPTPSSPPPPRASSSKPSQPTPPPAPAPAQGDEEMLDQDEAEAKKQAEAYKATGSAAYKKRDFAEAAKNFQLAWDTWPKDLTYLTNLGAAYFEQGEFDKAIEVCEKAVEEGRSIRADYKVIAKALGRIGSAYQKKGDPQLAIKYFQKSLTEHRTPDILNKLREVERQKADDDRKAYIDPEQSAAAREEGNLKFKAGDFAGAVKDYTESIKRDPSDARGYNNRAAAYMKLVAFPEALKDANEAIKVDPNFVKAYIRKSNILHGMRDYSQALEALQNATERDPEHQHAKEISQQEMKIQQAMFSQRGEETQEETLQRAMRDPEVAGIMNDPIMQQILQQAQTDPQALQDHMKNPVVRGKIQKLVNAGIIRTR
ncbi:hypothetical protein GALMADRAFT_1338233, partial [Galerina marginata CBS 339.88]